MTKISWVDIRAVGEAKTAILQEAIHQRVDGVLAADLADLADLPPTIKKVWFPDGQPSPERFPSADLVIIDPTRDKDVASYELAYPETEFGEFVEIVDAPTLECACQAARTRSVSLLKFRDTTKIPLEIVIAVATSTVGSIITEAKDVEEATIIFGVLEHGADGVLMAPRKVGDATELRAAATEKSPQLDLVELEVVRTEHVGMGERACVDTCTYFNEDEGILVGSHSKGMILCVSETHPLPYMPTRPFRVNAGAIHSYTISKDDRTHYLSELKAGSKVMAVDVKGQTRMVTVGRVKIESRPLISVTAVSPSQVEVNLILQDDWHVRVLGPHGAVLNSTELRPGDKILGYLPSADRHVGYPINEFCIER